MKTSTQTRDEVRRFYCDHRVRRNAKTDPDGYLLPDMVVCEVFFQLVEDDSGNCQATWELLENFDELYAALYEVALMARTPYPEFSSTEYCELIEAAIFCCSRMPDCRRDKLIELIELLFPLIAKIEQSPADIEAMLISQ